MEQNALVRIPVSKNTVFKQFMAEHFPSYVPSARIVGWPWRQEDAQVFLYYVPEGFFGLDIKEIIT